MEAIFILEIFFGCRSDFRIIIEKYIYNVFMRKFENVNTQFGFLFPLRKILHSK